MEESGAVAQGHDLEAVTRPGRLLLVKVLQRAQKDQIVGPPNSQAQAPHLSRVVLQSGPSTQITQIKCEVQRRAS